MYPFGQMFPQPPLAQYPQGASQRYEVREITSYKQAENFMPDPLVNSLFVNVQTGEIYLRKMCDDGRTRTFFYELNESAIKPRDPMEEMKSEIASLKRQLEELKNDKSVSNDAGYEKSDVGFAKPNDGANEKPKSAALSKRNGND